MSYEQDFIQKIVEGALFAAGEPLSVDRLLGLFEEHEMPEKEEVKAALQEIQLQSEGRAYNLVEVASGWRFQVREDLATWVNRLWEEKPQKYSRAMLETLALIAYRQPITRGDIEEVRGVAVSSHIIKTLTEREWVKVVGHRDVPGRPALYATTRHFLDYFNLKSLDELPTLGELKDIDSLNGDLEFGSDEPDTTELDEVIAEGGTSAIAEGDSSIVEGEDTAEGDDGAAEGENGVAEGEDGAAESEDSAIAKDSTGTTDDEPEMNEPGEADLESTAEVEDQAEPVEADLTDEEESSSNG